MKIRLRLGGKMSSRALTGLSSLVTKHPKSRGTHYVLIQLLSFPLVCLINLLPRARLVRKKSPDHTLGAGGPGRSGSRVHRAAECRIPASVWIQTVDGIHIPGQIIVMPMATSSPGIIPYTTLFHGDSLYEAVKGRDIHRFI